MTQMIASLLQPHASRYLMDILLFELDNTISFCLSVETLGKTKVLMVLMLGINQGKTLPILLLSHITVRLPALGQR